MFAAPVYEQQTSSFYLQLCNQIAASIKPRGCPYTLAKLESLGKRQTEKERERRNTDTQTEREIEYTETIRQRESDRHTKKIRNAQGHRKEIERED